MCPAPRPTPKPRHDPDRPPVPDEFEQVVAELRARQLDLARHGHVLESAEYAARAHRLMEHLSRPA